MSVRFPRLSWAVAGLLAVSACAIEPDADEEGVTNRIQSAIGKPDVAAGRYYVGFRVRPGASERAIIASRGAAVKAEMPDLAAFEIEAGSQADLAGIAAHGAVAYVEPVPMRYAMGLADAQLIPAMDNGLYGLITTKATTVHLAGNTGAGIKACVADTGLNTTHPDIAANFVAGVDTVGTTCKGTITNGVTDCPNPNVADGESHGTHVAGTILGVHNGVGVLGVAYGASLYHARVLGPAGGTTTDIMEGVGWLQKQGCQVVNLSLGGGTKSRTEENFYKNMRAAGVIVVAATGNDGKTSVSFPAGYAINVAVGAVDRTNAKASFSNTGRNIDVVAPGVGVLSSVRFGAGRVASLVAGGSTKAAQSFEFAGLTPATGITGTLVDCGLGTPGECPEGISGNIALIQRGTISFGEKVQNAMDQGAAAAILYNNVAGDFSGTLGAEGAWIPAISVSDTTGAGLAATLGSATVFNAASDWDTYDGTSMATPHVSGVVALLWKKYGGSGATQANKIEAKLKASATNLGAAGYDTIFGYGLVDAAAATTGNL